MPVGEKPDVDKVVSRQVVLSTKPPEKAGDRRTIQKVQRATRSGFMTMPAVTAFPPLEVAPPKPKPIQLQYPSGNAMGTQLHPAFGDRLKALMLTALKPKKLSSPI
jgi:hypothetical protein